MGSALAFTVPNRTPPPDGGPVLTRYFPLEDGEATLSERVDPQGDGIGWETSNTDVLGDGEALLSLSAATFTQITALYGQPKDDPTPPGLRHATVRVERVSTVDADGSLDPNEQVAQVITRDDLGDRLLTSTAANGELTFDPPALLLPVDLHAGQTWETKGKAGGQDYTLSGTAIERTKTTSHDDCIRLEFHTVVGQGETRSRSLVCTGVGTVERDDEDPDGTVFQHLDIVTSGTKRFTDATVPTASPTPVPDSPDGELTLGRVGRATPTGSISPPTFPATFVPTDPPSVLVASERGDLIALAVDTPDVARWRFHPGGSMYGPPGFDPETGHVYVGATDKRVYALDARGVFLWAVSADDNVATRPVIARGVVSFASEGGTAFGIDAVTGKQVWKRYLGGPAVAAPVVVDDTVVFGTDSGAIRALDIDDGGSRWTRSGQGSVEGALAADADGIVYVADGGGAVGAFDAATGATQWNVSTGDSFRTGPTVVDGLVVIVGDSGSVYARDAGTGSPVWASTGTFVGPAAATGGDIAIARSNGSIAEVDQKGFLVRDFSAGDAVAPTDPTPDFQLGLTAGGGAVWSVDQSTVVRRLGPGAGGLTALQARWVHPFSEAPFSGASFPTTVGELTGRAVLIDRGGAVYLVDPDTGDPQRIGDDPESPLPPGGDAVVDGSQLFMTLGGALRAIDLPSGKLLWTDSGTSFVPNGPVVVGNDVVLLRADPKEDGSVDADVTAFDRVSGKVQWTRHMTPAGSGPTVADDLLIVGSPLTALDPSDGSIVWQTEQGRDVVGRAAYDPERDAVVAVARKIDGNNVTIDLVSVDAHTGAEQWRVPLDGRPDFSEEITVAGDLVIVPELGFPIVAFDASTGAERWRFAPPTPARHLGSVTVENGQVWTFSSTAEVFVLDAGDGSVLAQSSGLGTDVGDVFSPWGQRIRSVGDVFIAPLGPFVAAFDAPGAG